MPLAFRLRYGNADDKGIVVKSSVDVTWKLAPKTDEQIQLDRDDLVNLKNITERRILLRMQQTRGHHLIVVRSSRRGAFYMSKIDCDTLWLDPGEVLNFQSNRARDPEGLPLKVAG